jgi:lipopolysaccharide transport system ATP-binding protein
MSRASRSTNSTPPRIVVRISVRAEDHVAVPNVGFMLRNQLGVDFSGTNTIREGHRLEPMQAGDVYTVDFHLDLPELYPASFSFSPAIADGDPDRVPDVRLDR